MKTFFFMVALACRSGIVHGVVLVVAEEAAPAPCTAAQELTPGLLISVESSGIPARALADDAEAGADDEATLEPEPHMPEVVANPEVADVADDIGDAAPVADVAVDAVAGAAVPFSVTPPPS
jgi:hypothetical protein